jgi:hypothetical protein
VRRQAVEDDIRTHFGRFFKREKRKIVGHIVSKIDPELLQKSDNEDKINAAINSYDWSNWQVAIEAAIPMFSEAFLTGADDASNYLSIDIPGTDPRALEYAQARAGELIGTGPDPAYALDEATRQMLHDTLVEQFEQGPQSIPDLSSVIRNNYAFSKSRATTIARTETGNAYNKGTVVRCRENGFEKVYVFDGDSDGECAEADGQIWSVDYADEHLLQHPNCVRVFSPYVGDEEVDRE